MQKKFDKLTLIKFQNLPSTSSLVVLECKFQIKGLWNLNRNFFRFMETSPFKFFLPSSKMFSTNFAVWRFVRFTIYESQALHSPYPNCCRFPAIQLSPNPDAQRWTHRALFCIEDLDAMTVKSCVKANRLCRNAVSSLVNASHCCTPWG